MSMLKTWRFLSTHPLTSRRRTDAVVRYLRWQLGARLSPGSIAVDFVNDARLLVRPGMTGATGNVYAGLHEFADMAFVLHCLREGDLFLDVGANVGSYTILAAKAAGSRCIAVEPVATAQRALEDNLRLNAVEERVTLVRAALGAAPGRVSMTADLDTVNRVTDDGGARAVELVRMDTLDNVVGDADPRMLKIDVEGYEHQVLAGGQRTLRRSTLLAILMETNGSGHRYGAQDAANDRLLRDHGFEPCRYDPFARALTPLGLDRSQEGNTLYVRDLEATRERLRSAEPFRTLGWTI